MTDTVRVWKPNSPNRAASTVILRGHEGQPRIAALSPDNRWLVTQSTDGGRLWDLAAPEQTLSPLVLPSDPELRTFYTFFNQKKKQLVVCGRYTPVVTLWDLSGSHPVVKELGRLEKQIQSVAISPNQRWFAVGSRIVKNGMLWDLWSPNPSAHPYILAGHKLGVSHLRFSPDGRWLLSGGHAPGGNISGKLLLWNMRAEDPKCEAARVASSESH